ncbi:hypothetical protein GCM10027447_15160 [Glycomyces halotolerans]
MELRPFDSVERSVPLGALKPWHLLILLPVVLLVVAGVVGLIVWLAIRSKRRTAPPGHPPQTYPPPGGPTQPPVYPPPGGPTHPYAGDAPGHGDGGSAPSADSGGGGGV